jgi:hypothetical protein
MLKNQEKSTHDAKDLAGVLTSIYNSNSDSNNVTSSIGNLCQSSEIYKETLDDINDSLSAVIRAVMNEKSMALKDQMALSMPEFESMKQNRSTAILDYDANRRRFDSLINKKRQLEASNKYVDDTRRNHQLKCDQYETKASTSGIAYEEINEKSKAFVIETKQRHDELMDALMITTAVCQLEFHKQAVDRLEKVVNTFEVQEVENVQSHINELLQNGGHQILSQEVSKRQSSSSSTVFRRLSGLFGDNSSLSTNKAGEGSDNYNINSNNHELPPEPPISTAPRLPKTSDSFENSSNTKNSQNPFADHTLSTSSSNNDNGASNISTMRIKTTKRYPIVKALFQHIAENDDELGFEEGEEIEVLEAENEGWWMGRCNGQEGIFPYNYVDSSSMNSN